MFFKKSEYKDEEDNLLIALARTTKGRAKGVRNRQRAPDRAEKHRTVPPAPPPLPGPLQRSEPLGVGVAIGLRAFAVVIVLRDTLPPARKSWPP